MTAAPPNIPDLEAAFAHALDEASLACYDGETIPTDGLLHRFRVAVNGGAKRDHRGGVKWDHLGAAGLSP